MSTPYFTIAQAVPGAVDKASFGQVIAGLGVMTAIAGSLIMLAVWAARLRNGVELMPYAARKPMYVPLPLVFGGLALTTLMAFMVASSGEVDEEIIDELETVNVATEPDAAGADENTVDENPEDEASATSAAAKTAKLKARLRTMMLGNIYANVMVFLVFGLTIWSAQRFQSRGQLALDDVGFAPISIVHPTPPAERFPDLDATPVQPVVTTDITNPYAAQMIDDADPSQPEPWNFMKELRFAFETFLIAYLPTAVLRLAIVSALPDAPSHPFLELMETGVDWEIMALIMVLAIVVAPVVEELLFRVTILGGMLQRESFAAGLVISSILFGLAHGFPDSVALLPLAFAIGFTYSRRRSYRTAVLVHFLFNGFNMVVAAAAMI